MSAPAFRAIAAFLALSTCAAFGQKAGEAPGPWLLGTVRAACALVNGDR